VLSLTYDYDTHQGEGMNIVKIFAALGALTLSSQALAQTHFECGTIACSAFGSAPITAIDDVVVGGDHFDVTFSNKQDTTFAFSQFPSMTGHPLTGIDAADALDAFYATQKGPNVYDDGPGIYAQVNGVDTEVYDIVTAFGTTKTPGVTNIDITEPFLGLINPDAKASQVTSSSLCSSSATCTVWTRIPAAAPEISVVSRSSALTLLLGFLAVLRGRRAGKTV
jgi:lipoprotein-anchoring transpeptidase ErfK/SrfK